MERVDPRELVTAARVADGLVVVVGVAGVVAGAQLFRSGELPYAIVAWVLTFVAGAALRLVVWMARGIAAVMDRTQRLEEDVTRMLREQAADRADEPAADPYRRWGGWH